MAGSKKFRHLQLVSAATHTLFFLENFYAQGDNMLRSSSSGTSALAPCFDILISPLLAISHNES